MIQLEFFSGEGSGQPGAVGAFQYISYVNQAMRRLLQAMTDGSENSILMRAAAAGTLMLRDITAYQFSPVLTGTLRAAHRGEVIMEGSDQAVGYIYIDPNIVNPVYGSMPAVYGMEVLESNNWPAQALASSADIVLTAMSDIAMGAFTEIIIG